MIKVRVGQDYGINFFGWNGRVLPVAFTPFFLPLEQAAINENLEAAVLLGI